MTTHYVGAVSVLVFWNKRLLSLRRVPTADAAPGAWEVISGRLKRGEQPYACALRELAEEAGLHMPVDPRPVDARQTLRGSRLMMVVYYRACLSLPNATEPPPVRLSNEHDAFAWLTAEEFATRCSFPLLVEVARAWWG